MRNHLLEITSVVILLFITIPVIQYFDQFVAQYNFIDLASFICLKFCLINKVPFLVMPAYEASSLNKSSKVWSYLMLNYFLTSAGIYPV